MSTETKQKTPPQFVVRVTADRQNRIDQFKIKAGLAIGTSATEILDSLLTIATQPVPETVADNSETLQALKSLQDRYTNLEDEAKIALISLIEKDQLIKQLEEELEQKKKTSETTYLKPPNAVVLQFDDFHYQLVRDITKIDYFRQQARKQNKSIADIEAEMGEVEITDQHIFDMLVNRCWLALQTSGHGDLDIVMLKPKQYNTIRSKYENGN